ncbi:hypothetical protein E4U22_000961 [Claviceps purpurea]|nr:hypothetical protein E4U38_007991 [Claviceps purpurea]KAG6153929.1 hypothetical protein E4U37_002549 [Claviceps purpurea]KAG6208894.1 hypothetical protein E4U35_007948 [Claviceps purpurea]KAG6263537.1 hypothetical protein E4U48_006712 [Claviceps purpurea]KAG6309798.1 hypothetical protein E4U44_006392 [Claviceps purpurea]
MAYQSGATFIPGGADDFYMPEVVAPFPQRITPQVPQNMQDDLQRLELEARHSDRQGSGPASSHHVQQSSSISGPQRGTYTCNDSTAPRADDIPLFKDSDNRALHSDDVGRDAPSFSPFPSVAGDNIPPADNAKEDILWNARKHVLHSQNVDMQISWARDVLIWAEIAMDASAREHAEKVRPSTPRVEHELRVDALNIIDHLAEQDHPDALYIRSKWLEFGKFGHRLNKRDAFLGYKRASELGNARSEYRMGMLFEQSNDISKAKEHYYKGMSLNDSAAWYRMGMMSLLGQHGEPKDYASGLERIRSAADSSDEDAPQGAYVYGMLVGRDLPDITIPDGLLAYSLDMAKMYVEKAAYLGFAKAQLKMGQAHELCQLGCEFNPSYSLHYYGLAAKQGLPEAALGVSRWFLFGYEGVFKKNEELAFKYAQEAAVAKLPTGEFAMGYYYEIGIHVNQNIPEAHKWYQRAADHGNKDALGRLESLSQHQSLSKQDHETMTLTRIKSQHGSQRGMRPERFKQAQPKLSTLDEGPSLHGNSISDTKSLPLAPQPVSRGTTAAGSPRVSPQPSLGIKPVAGIERPSAYSIRLDETDPQALARSHSAAPYPDEDTRPAPLSLNRSRSTAPYPDDDGHSSAEVGSFDAGLKPWQKTLHADRSAPSSAFGIQAQSPSGVHHLPQSYSTGSLQPPAQAGRYSRGRVASAGKDSQRPVGPGYNYGHSSPGFPTSSHRRPCMSSQQGHPGANMAASNEPPKQHAQNYERIPRVPVAAERPERLSSLSTPQNTTSHQPRPTAAGAARIGSVPAGTPVLQRPSESAKSPAAAPAKPSKGPATFEDMGIPHGKQEGDCVVM